MNTSQSPVGAGDALPRGEVQRAVPPAVFVPVSRPPADPSRVSSAFERGFRFAVIITVVFFWVPLALFIGWAVSR